MHCYYCAVTIEIIPHSCRRRAALSALSIAGALALPVGPVTVANALTPWWSPIQESCGANYVQLTFHVSGTGGPVLIGCALTNSGTGNRPYWTLHSGTNTVNTGFKTMWWQKWSNTGTADVCSWSAKCVNFT